MARSLALVVVVAGMAWGQSSVPRHGETGGAGALLDGGVGAVEASVKLRDLEDSSFDCLAGDPTACEEAAVAAEQADRLGYAESLRARAAELRRDVPAPSGMGQVAAPPSADLAEQEVELAPQGVHLVDRTDSGKRFTFGLLAGLGGAALGSVIGLGVGALVGLAGGLVLGPVGIVLGLAAGVVAGPLVGTTYGAGLAATEVASSFAGRKMSPRTGIIGGAVGVLLGVAISFGINAILQTSSPTPLTPGLAALLVVPIVLLAGLGGAVGAQFAESERSRMTDEMIDRIGGSDR